VAKPSRRTVLVSAALIAALLIAGNVAGLLRVPIGPIDAGGYGVGMSSSPGLTTGVQMCVGLFPRNGWPVAATIEQVRLINPSTGLRFVEARLTHPGLPANDGVGVVLCEAPEVDGLRLYSDYDPLPANLVANTSTGDGRMWVSVVADQPGELGFDGVDIYYRVGPFAFTTKVSLRFSACIAPMPAGATCSWDVP
jgi:hypothetical protein